jgi:galactose mutarotase-like enzyme
MSSLDTDLVVDLDNGGRLASLRVRGHELLITTGRSPIEWGLYPMAPYAGRVRAGRFNFDGTRYELPRTLNGHAIHGTVYLQEWEQEDDSTFVTDLGGPWPFPGFVRQAIRLDDHALHLRLEIHATEGPMPAAGGWHPWFRRQVANTELALDFRPGFILPRDEDGIATRQRGEVPAEPWDDCFGGVAAPPVLQWPGYLRLQMTTDCEWWVVYNERDYATCIEPQTAPPDALNNQPDLVKAGHPLVADLTLTWTEPK